MGFRERLIFYWEFLRDTPRVGSVTPSSKHLARSMTSELGRRDIAARILEVGAGTGSCTREILRKMRGDDTLDIYEVNPRFAQHLRERVLRGNGNGNVMVHEKDVLSMTPGNKYHYIVSGLPMNNLSPDRVRATMETFLGSLVPGGTLSFFEYIGSRPLQSLIVGREGRRRLREVGEILDEFLEQLEVRRDSVLVNIPPAFTHHLRVPE